MHEVWSLPPVSDDEWDAPSGWIAEAAPRRQSLHAAQRSVRQSRTAAERHAIRRLRDRLARLRADLLQILKGGTAFQRARAADLIASVDEAIAATHGDLARGARLDARTAAELGDTHVLEALRAVDLQPVAVGVDATLVTAAYENTVELLSLPMQEFRTAIVRQIRRLALGVTDFGAAWQALASDLMATGRASQRVEFQAERIVRTELSRTFNMATHERLVQQAQRWPFLRKGWGAVGDERTRETHLKAASTYRRQHGTIQVATRFAVGDASLRFPVDPLAEPPGRVSARETIMCRCFLFLDLTPRDLRQATAQRVRLALSQGRAADE